MCICYDCLINRHDWLSYENRVLTSHKGVWCVSNSSSPRLQVVTHISIPFMWGRGSVREDLKTNYTS